MSWRVVNTEKNRELFAEYIGNVYSSDRPPGGRPAPDLTWTDLKPTHRITHSWEGLDGQHIKVRQGRCAVHPGLHDETGECRGFMDIEFAKALGIDDPDA